MPASVHSQDQQDQSMLDAEQLQVQEQQQEQQEQEQDPFMLDEKRIVVVRDPDTEATIAVLRYSLTY